MINFPIKKLNTNNTTNNTNFSSRGMNLEVEINETNQYYLTNNIAVIHKKPTPVQIVKVNYPSRDKAVITEAYYKVPSTTDYNGIYKGKYIDFEAKETKNKTSFNLNNVHPHQVKHLTQISQHGGIGFFIISFSTLGEVYLYDIKPFLEFWNNKDLPTGRKSIPYLEIKTNGKKIDLGYLPRLNYLKKVDDLYF